MSNSFNDVEKEIAEAKRFAQNAIACANNAADGAKTTIDLVNHCVGMVQISMEALGRAETGAINLIFLIEVNLSESYWTESQWRMMITGFDIFSDHIFKDWQPAEKLYRTKLRLWENWKTKWVLMMLMIFRQMEWQYIFYVPCAPLENRVYTYHDFSLQLTKTKQKEAELLKKPKETPAGPSGQASQPGSGDLSAIPGSGGQRFLDQSVVILKEVSFFKVLKPFYCESLQYCFCSAGSRFAQKGPRGPNH